MPIIHDPFGTVRANLRQTSVNRSELFGQILAKHETDHDPF